MKKKTKPKPKRRAVRRSPYDRSLEHATARLDKAQSEWRECVAKLSALKDEIPKLQQIIQALGMSPVKVATEALMEYKATTPDGSEILVDPEKILAQPRTNVPSRQSMPTNLGELMKFIKPHPSVDKPPIATFSGSQAVDFSNDEAIEPIL